MRIDIRKAEKADVEALAFVVNETWKSEYADFITAADMRNFTAARRREEDFDRRIETGCVFALLLDGEICGVLSAEASAVPDACEIIQLYVLPQYHRRGFGRKLLNHSLRELRRLGYKKALLWVMDANKNAIAFYEKFGFAANGKREKTNSFETEITVSEYEIML